MAWAVAFAPLAAFEMVCVANFLKTSLAVAFGIALGLFATWLAVERGHGFGAVTAGPWTGWPNAGGEEADPYGRAVIARTGELPLSLAEGLAFIATSDSAGGRLDRKCVYAFRSPVPQARYWTLSVVDAEGTPIGSTQMRHGFTSSEIVRNGPSAFAIILSQQARAGHWLPLTGEGRFQLMLRLYDTPLSSNASALRAADMPSIERVNC